MVSNIFYFSIQLGMSSSQLTKSIIFQRGRSTTNQLMKFPYLEIWRIIHIWWFRIPIGLDFDSWISWPYYISMKQPWNNHMFPASRIQGRSRPLLRGRSWAFLWRRRHERRLVQSQGASTKNARSQGEKNSTSTGLIYWVYWEHPRTKWRVWMGEASNSTADFP